MKSRFYWTIDKEEELKKLWGTMSLYKLSEYFHTIPKTLELKAKELNLPAYKSNRWTEEEERLLIEYSKKYLVKTIAKKMNRTEQAIIHKAQKLEIQLKYQTDPWKKWMIDYLKDNINKKPIGEIEKVIGLSYRRILTKCKELGIEYIKEEWTEEEISILKEYAQKCHYTELVKVLPRRSVGAIAAKAYELEIETISTYHKTTDEIANYIRNNWGKIAITQMARDLKVNTAIIYRYKKELGLPNVGQKVKWDEKTLAKLRKLAEEKTREELAKIFKTSPSQITNVCSRNDIVLIDSKSIWNDELDIKLRQLVADNLSVAEISFEMEIKASTIRDRIKKLGLKVSDNRNKFNWNSQQIEVLRTKSYNHTVGHLALELNVSEKQVYDKLKKLKLPIFKEPLWTTEEIDLLFKLKDKYTLPRIVEIMGKKESSIRYKAEELEIKLLYNDRKRWTAEEENSLRLYANDCTIHEIAIILNRTDSSVASKLRYMGLSAQLDSKFWTDEEVETLVRLNEVYDVSQIMSIMNKSYGSIISKLYSLELRVVNKSNKPWTNDEENYLLELLSSYSTFEIVSYLNRSEEAIRRKAIELGYDIDIKNRRWSLEEEEMLSDLWGTKSVEYIANKLNRSCSSIYNRVNFLGLGSAISNNYDGLTIPEISCMFNVPSYIILTSWVALGLVVTSRKVSAFKVYSYVTIQHLYQFLEMNQNIWDSRCLEKNILGVEPDWLKLKRKNDLLSSSGNEKLFLTKQQLLLSQKFFLQLEKVEDKEELISDESSNKVMKKTLLEGENYDE